MYKIVSAISVLTRTFLLPNPFSTILKTEGMAFMVNATIGNFIMWLMSFTMSGIFYTPKIDLHSKGSILYLIFFIINTLIFMLLGQYIKTVKWFVIIGIMVYIIVYGLLIFVRLNGNGRGRISKKI